MKPLSSWNGLNVWLLNALHSYIVYGLIKSVIGALVRLCVLALASVCKIVYGYVFVYTRFFISILYFWLSLNMLKNCPNVRLKYAYGMLKIRVTDKTFLDF